MEKIKAFFCKMNRNLLLYSIILLVILAISHFVLKLFCLRFRQWVYLTIITISITLILIRLIQKFIKQSKKIKLVIGYICAILVVLGIIFWKILLLMIFLIVLIINPKTEYVVERQGNKYVASVESFLSDTKVYFYEYVNSFVMGYESEFEEYYDGAYDPIEKENENSERDEESENIITSEENVSDVEQTKTEIIDSSNVLYEKEIRKDTTIRIIYGGSVLGGRMGIKVQKTTDGGNIWINQLKTSDGYMTVNNGAKFIFMNEKVGFINNLSLLILGEENNSLLVTVDGGKNYKSSNFVFPLDIKDSVFYINDLPYLENGKLKVKLFVSGSDENTYYEFTSVDNGLNWVYGK